MKALVWKGPNDIRVEEVREPELSAGSVLIRVTSASICGSDIAGYTGRMGNRSPGQIMGHEFAGVVVDVAGGGGGEWVGRRVTVNPLVTCGVCRACVSGNRQRCNEATLIGVHRSGGFAEAVSVPLPNAIALTADFPELLASLVEPVSHGFHGARIAVDGISGGSLLVLGGGPVGLFAALAARRLGAERIALLERDPQRVALARGMGLTAFESASDSNADTERPDVVIDAVGSFATRSLAVELVRRGGLVVLDGLAEPTGDFPFMQALVKEVELRGAFAYASGDFESAIAALTADVFGIEALVETTSFQRGPATFQAMAAGELSVLKTVLEVSTP